MAYLRSQFSTNDDDEECDGDYLPILDGGDTETEVISVQLPMSAISLPAIPSGGSSTLTLKAIEEEEFDPEIECPYTNITKVSTNIMYVCTYRVFHNDNEVSNFEG